MSQLNRKLRTAQSQLKFDGEQGYLRSVLAALNVPIESQIAVFRKQVFRRIASVRRARARFFFNDSVAVGWVRAGFVELTPQDPRPGVIFYTLEQKPWARPALRRQDQCLICRDSNESLGVPGMMVTSNFTAPDGMTLRELGGYDTDHRTPLEQRWGGWYVTGKLACPAT